MQLCGEVRLPWMWMVALPQPLCLPPLQVLLPPWAALTLHPVTETSFQVLRALLLPRLSTSHLHFPFPANVFLSFLSHCHIHIHVLLIFLPRFCVCEREACRWQDGAPQQHLINCCWVQGLSDTQLGSQIPASGLQHSTRG